METTSMLGILIGAQGRCLRPPTLPTTDDQRDVHSAEIEEANVVAEPPEVQTIVDENESQKALGGPIGERTVQVRAEIEARSRGIESP